jgi:hypothetical protein
MHVACIYGNAIIETNGNRVACTQDASHTRTQDSTHAP